MSKTTARANRPPVRWFHLLSYWILILSCLHPFLHIPTYPLNCLAAVGCYKFIRDPFAHSLLYNVVIILGVHLAPFAWIPYDVSEHALRVACAVIVAYFFFIHVVMRRTVREIYETVLYHEHFTTEWQYVRARIYGKGKR